MSQALYTSKSGIAAGQTQIDVIANNVANINTTAYKTANVTFSTLFSKTLSRGSAATQDGGGTNPRQIGLGTQVSSISRDFSTGSFQQTGLSSDAMITANGYFVVQDSAGNQFLTRDGHFSLDSDGNLVTAAGYKVVGTADDYTNRSSSMTIKIPSQLGIDVYGSPRAEMSDKIVSDLNAVSISEGTFTFNIGPNSHDLDAADFVQDVPGDDSKYTYNGTVHYSKLDYNTLSDADYNSLRSIYGEVDPAQVYYKGDDGTFIKGEIPTAGTVIAKNVQKTLSYNITSADLNGTLEDLITSINAELNQQLAAQFPGLPGGQNIEFSIIDGGIQMVNNTGMSLKAADAQGSSFLKETGLDIALENAVNGQTAFISEDMNKSADITQSGSFTGSAKRTDWAISENGTLSATYDDGSTLTVQMTESGRLEWKLVTQDNTIITGNGGANSDIDMTEAGLDPANMVLEMATVVNDGGLVAQQDNMWSIGPNAGEAYYGMSGSHGFSSLKTGGLEGSNVDMTTELSNMITAQRAIQINSRVFTTASSVLESLSYLGQ